MKVSAPQQILANIGLAAKYDNNVRLSAFNMNEKKCIHLAVYHIFQILCAIDIYIYKKRGVFEIKNQRIRIVGCKGGTK